MLVGCMWLGTDFIFLWRLCGRSRATLDTCGRKSDREIRDVDAPVCLSQVTLSGEELVVCWCQPQFLWRELQRRLEVNDSANYPFGLDLVVLDMGLSRQKAVPTNESGRRRKARGHLGVFERVLDDAALLVHLEHELCLRRLLQLIRHLALVAYNRMQSGT